MSAFGSGLGDCLGAIALTAAAYVASRNLRSLVVHPLTTPLFSSTALLGAVLLAGHIPYETYRAGAAPIVQALGPLSAALAVPLYKNRAALGTYLGRALLALALGSLTSLCTGVGLGRLIAMPHELLVPLGLKSSTSPIALELAGSLHADVSLTVGLVLATGMLGAMFGPALLDLARVRAPLARGLSLGTMAHVSGTAQAYSESEAAGAVSGFALGASGIVMSLIGPALLPALIGSAK